MFEYAEISYHGPAISVTYDESVDVDKVASIPVPGFPHDADDFLKRPRPFHTPSRDLIKEAIELGHHVVGVSPKSSSTNDQWRVSFSLLEKMIISEWNETSIKCYNLLKVILKSCNLKQYGICSYHAKTILLWLHEQKEPGFWKPENIFNCLQSSMETLRKAVLDERLSNYFIEQQNIMQNCILKKTELLQNLTHVINNIPSIVNDGLDSAKSKMLSYASFVHPQRKKIYENNPVQFELFLFGYYLCWDLSMCQGSIVKHINDIISSAPVPIEPRLAERWVTEVKKKITTSCFKIAIPDSILDILCGPYLSFVSSVVFASQFEKLASSDTANLSESLSTRFQPVLNLLESFSNTDIASGKLRTAFALYKVGEIDKAVALLENVIPECHRPHVFICSDFDSEKDCMDYVCSFDDKIRNISIRGKPVDVETFLRNYILFDVYFLSSAAPLLRDLPGFDELFTSPSYDTTDLSTGGLVVFDPLFFAYYLLIICLTKKGDFTERTECMQNMTNDFSNEQHGKRHRKTTELLVRRCTEICNSTEGVDCDY